MIDGATADLAIGLGCQRGCPAATLLALLEQVLQAHRIPLDSVRALASIAQKQDEAGLHELAELLDLPLVFFDAGQLDPFETQLSQRSQIAYERTGCYGVAESAALALAASLGNGHSELLVPRQKYAQATIALACVGKKPR